MIAGSMSSNNTTILWDAARTAILDHINGAGEMDKFTSWAVITATMFVGNAPYLPRELQFVKEKRPGWLHALEYPLEFGQVPSDIHPGTCGNAIHQLYHLARWSLFNPLFPDQYNRIVEIGAGYGEMCRLAYQLGFDGEYFIYDLPEVHQLQQLYLNKCLPIDSRVYYLDDPKYLPRDCDLLIGCFSISEMPLWLREEILRMVVPESYLIVYQPGFYGLDNDSWASSLYAQKLPDYFIIMDKNPDSNTDWRYFIANRQEK